MSKIEIDLNTDPDVFGFLHGEVRQGECVMPYRIMPPFHLWRGQEMHPNCAPFDAQWQVIVDNLLTVVERYEDLGESLMSLLGHFKEAQAAGRRLASWARERALGPGHDKAEGSRRTDPPVDDPQQRSKRWRAELPFLAAKYPELAPLAREFGVFDDDPDEGATSH